MTLIIITNKQNLIANTCTNRIYSTHKHICNSERERELSLAHFARIRISNIIYVFKLREKKSKRKTLNHHRLKKIQNLRLLTVCNLKEREYTHTLIYLYIYIYMDMHLICWCRCLSKKKNEENE